MARNWTVQGSACSTSFVRGEFPNRVQVTAVGITLWDGSTTLSLYLADHSTDGFRTPRDIGKYASVAEARAAAEAILGIMEAIASVSPVSA